MSTRISELETKLSQSNTDISQLQSENKQLDNDKQELEKQLSVSSNGEQNSAGVTVEEMDRLRSNIERLEAECQTANQEFERIQKEQEDLLVLLTDTDEKKEKYKAILVELGEPVSGGILFVA